jgi:5-methylthioadenosine/S-adenosylhomocysteine deaminase
MRLPVLAFLLGAALCGVAFLEGRLRANRQATGAAAELVISGGTVVTMDSERRVIPDGAVAIRGAQIAAVGTTAEVRGAHPHARLLEATGRIVLPGLVNTHTHAPMVMYRGLADDRSLEEWLERYIFPAEAKTVNPAFVRVGTQLAVIEMLRSGTTTYADMYYFEEEVARATREAGLRAVLGQTVIRFPAPDAATAQQALDRAERFVAAFKGDSLITPAIAPHSMYLLERSELLACRQLAVKHGVPMLIHLAETKGEVASSRDRHRGTPVAYLEAIGFWAPVTIAAHAIWVTDADITLLKQRRVGVSHNPESNMKLASGVAPVPKYLEAGVMVGLGTDGAASNNNLDMFEAMRQTALLHKSSTGDPRAVPAASVLEMATIGGARVLGLEKSIGSLETGKRADIIIVNATEPQHTPMYDPVSHLVYVATGSDVETTIVHGRVLMEGRKVRSLDEPHVVAAARRLAHDVRRAVSQQPAP